jgi:cystathionine beta-synthase
MVPYPDVLHLIGNTPLIELHSFDTGPCRLFVKLESQNPGGSIKDRIGRSMIEVAEREKKIGPGSVLVEATAGNTGLGLALVAAQKGYRLILVIPDKMSQEKVLHLKGPGRRDRHDPQRRGQGPSAVLSGPGREDHAGNAAGVLREPVQ